MEDILGHLSGLAHYVFGFTGIAGGALAATAAGEDWPTWVSVLGGVLAAVGSGAATFFDFERRAELLWERAAAFHKVADFAENRRACLTADDDRVCAELAAVQDRLDDARLRAARVPSADRAPRTEQQPHSSDLSPPPENGGAE